MMLQPTLSQLETSGLVRAAGQSPELEYSFKHALVQQTLYEALLKHDRKRLHRLVARGLETAFQEQLDARAGELALHWDEAGEGERAFEYYLRAGAQAARVYANREALWAYDRAVALAQEITAPSERVLELYQRRGRVLELRGEYDAALENYAALEKSAQARGDASLEIGALIGQATLHSTLTARFNPEEAGELSQRALELARRIGDRASEARVLWTLMLMHHFAQRPAQAVEYGKASLALARELNLTEQLAYTLHDLARVYLTLERLPEARADLAEAEALWRQMGNLPMVADALATSAGFAIYTGVDDQAIAQLEEANRINVAIGSLWGQAFSQQNLGMIYDRRGELDRALPLLLSSARLGEQVGFLNAQYMSNWWAAQVYAELGVPERGLPHIERLIVQGAERPDWDATSWSLLALLHAQRGEWERAHECLDRARRLLDPNRYSLGSWGSSLGIAWILLAEHKDTEALATASASEQFALERGMRAFLPRILFYKGEAQYRLGRRDEAYQTFQQARELAETFDRRLLWYILVRLSEIASARGNAAAAAELWERARAELRFIAAHAPDDLRATFQRRPEINAVLHGEPGTPVDFFATSPQTAP